MSLDRLLDAIEKVAPVVAVLLTISVLAGTVAAVLVADWPWFMVPVAAVAAVTGVVLAVRPHEEPG